MATPGRATPADKAKGAAGPWGTEVRAAASPHPPFGGSLSVSPRAVGCAE